MKLAHWKIGGVLAVYSVLMWLSGGLSEVETRVTIITAFIIGPACFWLGRYELLEEQKNSTRTAAG